MRQLKWFAKSFANLHTQELHAIYALRTAVFVVEQDCAYQEVDLKDPKSVHVFAQNDAGQIIAVSRIVPPGVSYNELSIGRVAVHKDHRKEGLGDELMSRTLEYISELFGAQPIRISAQEYLVQYYAKHGFQAVGEMYLEDGIPHVEMLRST